ncbi:prevent-host-death protein [Megamonas hypermegale]|uniref:prevent-host-death protein n=1 Tax=Megamonas hypermegale TaxID=158847 RepID=UPI0026EF3AAB|nr:prevent-host-death protein [Megamonas hypermegale]
MTLEEIKNEVLNNIKDFVTNEVKDVAMRWIKNTAFPYVKEVATAFIAELKNSAADEKGWVKFRDLIFLPVLISGGIWILEKVLNMLAPDTETTE